MNIPANAGDIRDANSILGLGRSPAGGHGNPLQCSWLEKPLNRGARWATVHWTAKSQTWLKWQYSLINMFASLLHAYSHLFIFYTFPMIHNMVKWHVGCNYTHTHSYTHKEVEGYFLEFPRPHEFKAKAIVPVTTSIKPGHQNSDICINSVDTSQQVTIATCQR